MRVVALEEHFNVPALVKRIDPAAISRPRLHARADRPRAGRTRWRCCPRSASSG